MVRSITFRPSGAPRWFTHRAAAAALCGAMCAAATDVRAQQGRGDGFSRGGGYGDHAGRGHREGRGGGGAGVAGVLIGLGAGLLIEGVRARGAERDEVQAYDGDERPRRRPTTRRPRVEPDVELAEEPRRRPRAAPKSKAARTPPAKRPATMPAIADGGSGTPKPPGVARPARPAAAAPVLAARASVADEVLCEVRAGTPDAEIVALGRRQRLERLTAERFDLTGSTIIRYRIRDRRSVAAAVSDLTAEPIVVTAQPNNVYALSGAVRARFADAQYAAAKLRLREAQTSATGSGVAIAVIDSAVDPRHPALKDVVVETFDPVGGPVKPHPHGTAVAGLAAGRGDLASPAPGADILAIRAFAPEHAAKSGAQGTTMHILRGLDWAAKRGARIVNMSFAGPKDAKIAEFIAAGAARGAIHVAAAGNAGPNSPALYPAADPNVIAVTATDADDRLLKVANRGAHLAVAAPGVDVLVAAPGGGFGYLSGTSMASAEIAGVVALMVEAKPGLAAWQARAARAASARDLGAPGPDAEFGAGVADARAALDALARRAKTRSTHLSPKPRGPPSRPSRPTARTSRSAPDRMDRQTRSGREPFVGAARPMEASLRRAL